MAKANLRLDWATHEAATFACKNWHYSKTVPKSKHVNIGVWEDGQFIGCVIIAMGASSHLGAPYGLHHFQCSELARVALRQHKTEVSRIISIAVRMFANQSPGIRLIVSYADPFEGHHGGIYQAGGWIYTGVTSPDWAVIDWKGKRHHSRIASESGFKSQYGRMTRVIRPSEGRKIELPGKHRYLMPLDAAIRSQVSLLAKPYPKRAKQAMTETPSEQRRSITDPHAPPPL
jgi:hypothetical protein